MSQFREIDSKLEKLSSQLNAHLTKDRPDYPAELRTFEERRIDWEKDDIRRAIIIQPTFEWNGVNASKWNFVNVAWKAEGCSRRQYIKSLIIEKEFSTIAENIDSLLEESVKVLTSISETALT